MTRSAVSEQLQIAWNTVGPVVKRVYDDLEKQQPHSKFDNLTCIGIDETSYKKGHKYMTVVVDNANATIIWASKEHGASVLSKFFEMLTPEQRAKIEYVTGDGARWIKDCANKYCKKAEFCIDPFHVTSWATAALDEVRREVYNQAKNGEPSREKGKRGRPTKGTPKKGKEASKVVKGAKFALLRNPENISENQAAMIHIIAKSNPLLYRAYQLKELLRLLMKLPLESAQKELDRWIGWARRSRIPTFVNLQKKICRHYYSILSTIKYGLSNSRIEAVNNNIKVTSRMGYGFRNVDNLIALIMMKCSGIKVKIPGLCPEFVWF
jgi:transposase